MKEIIISVQQQKREMFFLAVSLTIAIILNILGILIYETPFTEFFTELPYVVVITMFIYAVTVVVRLIIHFVKSIINKKS
jgi:hypothetical protein